MNLSAEDFRRLNKMVDNLDKAGAYFNGTVRHLTEAGQGVMLTVRYDDNSGKHYVTFPNPQ
jgi:hypothetical protein